MIPILVTGLVEFFGTIAIMLLALGAAAVVTFKLCDARLRWVENSQKKREQKLRYSEINDEALMIVNNYMKKDKQES